MKRDAAEAAFRYSIVASGPNGVGDTAVGRWPCFLGRLEKMLALYGQMVPLTLFSHNNL